MDQTHKEKEVKSEKEKFKQFLEDKLKSDEKSQETSETVQTNKSGEVIKTSSTSSTSSSRGACRARRLSEEFYPKKSSRKRKASRESARGSKKFRKGRNSLERNRQNFKKREEKHAKRSKSYVKKSTVKFNKLDKKQKDCYSDKSDAGYKSDDKYRSDNGYKSEDKYNKEYNKKLDCLAKYGANFYCPSLKQQRGLRPIYIDGSNVAFSHGQNEIFSVKGLKICIEYFRKRGHEVKAFVPHFRLRKGETTDQKLLHELVNKKHVITTPTLYIQNQRRSPYDDWYIVQSAAANGGIIISADNFQDIIRWNPNLRSVIEECRLVPTFVDDMIIFPVDPHGNRRNNLEQFLKF